MAIKQGDKYFTKFMHIEPGRTFTRSLHEIVVQDANGKTHYVKGTKLPNFLQVNCEESSTGFHFGEILLGANSKSKFSKLFRDPRPWPSWRDVVNFAIGFCAISLLNFIGSVLGLY